MTKWQPPAMLCCSHSQVRSTVIRLGRSHYDLWTGRCLQTPTISMMTAGAMRTRACWRLVSERMTC